jgi:hypothetical protein
MEFSVNSRALGGLADMLDRRADDLTRTAGYLDAESYIQYGPGLLNHLSGAHTRIANEADAFLRRAAKGHAHQYSVGVAGAVQDYTGSDQASSARIDATLPDAPSGIPAVATLADQSLGPEVFADPYKLVLKVPPDFSAEHPYKPAWSDVFSPNSIIRDVLWSLSKFAVVLGILDKPIDPFEAFTVPLFGDWAGLKRFAFALRQAGQAVSYVADRVTSGTVTCDEVWTGHAADNCTAVLHRFALDLRHGRTVFDELARTYDEVADAAQRTGEAVGHLVAICADVASTLGVEALFEGPEIVLEAAKYADLAEEILRLIEGGVVAVEGGRNIGEVKADAMSLLLTGSMDASLSDAMPVLPTPPHGR